MSLAELQEQVAQQTAADGPPREFNDLRRRPIVRIPDGAVHLSGWVFLREPAFGQVPESTWPAICVARSGYPPHSNLDNEHDFAGVGPKSCRRLGSKPTRALLAHKLLAQNVCVAAMLSKLSQDMEIHPAERQRAASIPVDQIVQSEG